MPFHAIPDHADQRRALRCHGSPPDRDGPSLIFYCYSQNDRFAWLRLNQIAHIETIEQAA